MWVQPEMEDAMDKLKTDDEASSATACWADMAAALFDGHTWGKPVRCRKPKGWKKKKARRKMVRASRRANR
jgi:hypothetical protein